MAKKGRAGYGHRNRRLADMSLPAWARGRRRGKRVGGTPPAQMDHASGAKGARRRREGEKKMRRSR
jgi:hypothetical protein